MTSRSGCRLTHRRNTEEPHVAADRSAGTAPYSWCSVVFGKTLPSESVVLKFAQCFSRPWPSASLEPIPHPPSTHPALSRAHSVTPHSPRPFMPPVSFSSTPNPNALRCDAPGARWPAPTTQLRGQPLSIRAFRSAAAALAAGDHFAHELLLIPGLTGVLIHDDWLTISKLPEGKWPAIKRAVNAIILAAAQGGQP